MRRSIHRGRYPQCLHRGDGRGAAPGRAVETIHRQQGQVFSHDYDRELLILEVDLTGLTASKDAEGSTKGYFPGRRNRRGRQLNWCG